MSPYNERESAIYLHSIKAKKQNKSSKIFMGGTASTKNIVPRETPPPTYAQAISGIVVKPEDLFTENEPKKNKFGHFDGPMSQPVYPMSCNLAGPGMYIEPECDNQCADLELGAICDFDIDVDFDEDSTVLCSSFCEILSQLCN